MLFYNFGGIGNNILFWALGKENLCEIGMSLADTEDTFSFFINKIMMFYMTAYFKWIKSSSADLTTALQRNQLRSTYTKTNSETAESRSALWVFRMGGTNYTPSTRIMSDRTLVKITFRPEGEAIMESKDNHINFESQSFEGEAGHPLKIIVKNNEPGARGIGAKILEFLNAHIASIEHASSSEVKKAGG